MMENKGYQQGWEVTIIQRDTSQKEMAALMLAS